MDNIEIRAYGRTELAQLYCPTLSSQAAYRKLQSWIDFYPGLRNRLQATGYREHGRTFLPIHVKMIVEAIGEP